MRQILLAIAACLIVSASAPAQRVKFTDYAGDFDRFEARTRGMDADARVALFRQTFAHIRPGLYADTDDAALDKRIARALADFPAIRDRYRAVEGRFPSALATAVARFRTIFPQFRSPLPIILADELGVRDGGSDYVGGGKVMLFGADVIARIHDDDSLQPFLDHELFHLEHARHFADCDPFWCLLWQEGMATYAAQRMTPHATDHQLLLDQPRPIRAETDAHWGEALCRVAGTFDSSEAEATDQAFLGNHHPPELPPRYGYYIGLRIVEAAARGQSLPALARLDDEAARPVVVAALARLIAEGRAPCTPPAPQGPITHAASHPA